MKLFRQLLQCPRSIRIQSLEVDADQHEFAFELVSLQRKAKCPKCEKVSKRIHSRYRRTISDLPWANWAVRLHVAVRKFFCSNRACKRRIFCERICSLAAPWERKTRRLCDQLRHIASIAGASSGAWLSQKLDRYVSRNTLLRLIRATPKEPQPTPSVLGVDDLSGVSTIPHLFGVKPSTLPVDFS